MIKAEPNTSLLTLDLTPSPHPVSRLPFGFSPNRTEKRPENRSDPEFGILASRIRDRISTLRELYGSGPLPIDFRAFGERASLVKMSRCDIENVEIRRRSSRTGQVHPIGGFTGQAEYEGDLDEFSPT